MRLGRRMPGLYLSCHLGSDRRRMYDMDERKSIYRKKPPRGKHQTAAASVPHPFGRSGVRASSRLFLVTDTARCRSMTSLEHLREFLRLSSVILRSRRTRCFSTCVIPIMPDCSSTDRPVCDVHITAVKVNFCTLGCPNWSKDFMKPAASKAQALMEEDGGPQQIKFEHFCSGFVDAVRRNRNASERTGHGGCAHGRSRRGSTAQHSPAHGLRRRRRKTPATANPPQPRFVTPKGMMGVVGWMLLLLSQMLVPVASQKPPGLSVGVIMGQTRPVSDQELLPPRRPDDALDISVVALRINETDPKSVITQTTNIQPFKGMIGRFKCISLDQISSELRCAKKKKKKKATDNTKTDTQRGLDFGATLQFGKSAAQNSAVLPWLVSQPRNGNV
ncbi:hypothetical protein F2P81_010001 [Scophthalmus maximus]|uniref:Uncharacterized protein n=1 Tax=Scophthalmus maximus TaxID=52904 RepID=A0A6A4SUI8_SCOMX|nr:hypothetical protein F2P81_010001 [Scophthalmus maximus]